MTEARRSSTNDDDFATIDLINEARRPILIARHRELVTDMEQTLSEAFVTGNGEGKRFKAMIEELASESESRRIQRTLKSLIDDHHNNDLTLQQALTEYLCLLREEHNVEVAALQMHAIGVYRAVRALVIARQHDAPTLDELREMSLTGVGTLLDPQTPVFGRLGGAQVYTRSFIERTLKSIKRLRQGDRPDTSWHDEDSATVITREDQAQVMQMPESERDQAMAFLIRDRIRSRFYRSVFLEYLSPDEFEPSEAEAHPTVLSWLQGLADTPHLYSFLQGQPERQKTFRIALLTQKIVQLFEIYARMAIAESDPRHQQSLAGKTSRERLLYLGKIHYPPIALSPELTLSALLCPFAAFVEFVQQRTQSSDFVLPPDPKR
jgi:hypothetical protein